jgi:hypothetical protein
MKGAWRPGVPADAARSPVRADSASSAASPAGDPSLASPLGTGPTTSACEILEAEAAAARFGISVRAFRARCRRHLRREGRLLVARLGPGLIAFKFGVSWRLRVDPIV